MPAVKLSQCRFAVVPVEGKALGEQLVQMNLDRLDKGLRVDGTPAKPLSTGRNGRGGYAREKQRKGEQPIRDWHLSGLTRSAMCAIESGDNYTVVGFNNPEANRRAAINNSRELQFGVNERELAELEASAVEQNPVRVVNNA